MSTEAWLWSSNVLLAVALVIVLKAYALSARRVMALERKLFAREVQLTLNESLTYDAKTGRYFHAFDDDPKQR